jgi:hypothetical protein
VPFLALCLAIGAIAVPQRSDATAPVGAPFFMFAASQFSSPDETAKINAILHHRVTSADYLSAAVTALHPDLGNIIRRDHVFSLPTNLNGVGNQAGKCGSSTPGLIIYDPEHWPGTPAAEKADVAAALRQARDIIVNSNCHQAGFAPDGRFSGIRPDACAYDLGASVMNAVDWTNIALADLQSQILIGKRCNASAGLTAYVTFNSALANAIHAKAPKVKVIAELGFRGVSPERMIQAVAALTGVVDGFYIAYPATSGSPCTYCSPGNLDAVLAAFHH